jgi:hypothetical protein
MEIKNAEVDANFEFVENIAKKFTKNKLLAGNCCSQHCLKVNIIFPSLLFITFLHDLFFATFLTYS